MSTKQKITCKGKMTWITPVVYLIVLLVWLAAILYASYFVPALGDPNTNVFTDNRQVIFRYGFNQLRFLHPILLVALLGFTVTLIANKFVFAEIKMWIEMFFSKPTVSIWVLRTSVSLLAAAVFWLFRSNYENIDFLAYLEWYPDHMARGIPHVRFDEMWESYIHYALFVFFNSNFGWTLQQVFHFTSVLSGGIFIFLAQVFSSEANPEKPYRMFLILLSGGFMQLFFGDLECYTITGMLTFAYLFTSYLFMKKEVSLVVPTFILILAMTAHLETIFLVPSLVFLFIIQVSRREYLSIVISIMVFTGFFSWTLLFFIKNGVSLQGLIDMSWGMGRGGSILANFMLFQPEYFWGQINLLGLIFPLVWFLLLLFATGGVKFSKENIFLSLASISGIIFFFSWTSSIGLYMDWNLFSVPMIPAAVLFASNFTKQNFKHQSILAPFIVVLAALLTYTWIVSNHFLVQ